jgi:hypothetical protein
MAKKRPPNLIKGAKLEDAVELIERTILHASGFDSSPRAITVERDKIIEPKGVKHEIDLYVVVNRESGYEAVYIFECKNWQRNVGKNPINDFAVKIEAVGAQQGFFIARGFGRYAKAQAGQYPRMVLLNANDTNVDPTVFPHTHYLWENRGERKTDIQFDLDSEPLDTPEVLLRDVQASLAGRMQDPATFIDSLVDLTVKERLSHTGTAHLPEGPITITATKIIDFQGKDLVVRDVPCTAIHVTVVSTQHVLHPKIVARFDVETRGRTLTYEAVAPDGTTLSTAYVEVLQGAGASPHGRIELSVRSPNVVAG